MLNSGLRNCVFQKFETFLTFSDVLFKSRQKFQVCSGGGRGRVDVEGGLVHVEQMLSEPYRRVARSFSLIDARGDAFHEAIGARFEEERAGESVPASAGRIDDAMQCGFELVVRPSLHHVADVDHERMGDRFNWNPLALLGIKLQSPSILIILMRRSKPS